MTAELVVTGLVSDQYRSYEVAVWIAGHWTVLIPSPGWTDRLVTAAGGGPTGIPLASGDSSLSPYWLSAVTR